MDELHYSSEHALYFHEVACGSAWVDEDEAACGCRGSGWWLSELDTFHKCPLHAPDAPHPLDEEVPEDDALLGLPLDPLVQALPSDDFGF
jgi:hypothetical protein